MGVVFLPRKSRKIGESRYWRALREPLHMGGHPGGGIVVASRGDDPDDLATVHVLLGDPTRGAGYGREEGSAEGRAPPMAPPNLIWLVLLVDLLVFLLISPVNLLLFWNRVACNFITLYS